MTKTTIATAVLLLLWSSPSQLVEASSSHNLRSLTIQKTGNIMNQREKQKLTDISQPLEATDEVVSSSSSTSNINENTNAFVHQSKQFNFDIGSIGSGAGGFGSVGATPAPTTQAPTTAAPTTATPTTAAPTTAAPTTPMPVTDAPTTASPTTAAPVIAPTDPPVPQGNPPSLAPTTANPTTLPPTTQRPKTPSPTTQLPISTPSPTTTKPTTPPPTKTSPKTPSPTTPKPTTPPPVESPNDDGGDVVIATETPLLVEGEVYGSCEFRFFLEMAPPYEPSQEEVEEMLCEADWYFTEMIQDVLGDDMTFAMNNLHYIFTPGNPQSQLSVVVNTHAWNPNTNEIADPIDVLSTMNSFDIGHFAANVLWPLPSDSIFQDAIQLSFLGTLDVYHPTADDLALLETRFDSIACGEEPTLPPTVGPLNQHNSAAVVSLTYGFSSDVATPIREPSNAEIRDLMCLTDDYFTTLLQVKLKDPFLVLTLQHITPMYIPALQNPVRVQFNVAGISTRTGQEYSHQMLLSNMASNLDVQEYASNYVWQVEPTEEGDSQLFYYTETVLFSGSIRRKQASEFESTGMDTSRCGMPPTEFPTQSPNQPVSSESSSDAQTTVPAPTPPPKTSNENTASAASVVNADDSDTTILRDEVSFHEVVDGINITQCLTIMGLSDMNRDNYMSTEDYLWMLNLIAADVYWDATLESLPQILQDNFHLFADPDDDTVIYIYGDERTEQDNLSQEQVQHLEDFCVSTFEAIEVAGTPAPTVARTPPPTPATIYMVGTKSVNKTICRNAMQIADANQDRFLSRGDFHSFVNTLITMNSPNVIPEDSLASSFGTLPTDLRRAFTKYASVKEVVDIYGVVVKEESTTVDQQIFLNDFCEDTLLQIHATGSGDILPAGATMMHINATFVVANTFGITEIDTVNRSGVHAAFTNFAQKVVSELDLERPTFRQRQLEGVLRDQKQRRRRRAQATVEPDSAVPFQMVPWDCPNWADENSDCLYAFGWFSMVMINENVDEITAQADEAVIYGIANGILNEELLKIDKRSLFTIGPPAEATIPVANPDDLIATNSSRDQDIDEDGAGTKIDKLDDLVSSSAADAGSSAVKKFGLMVVIVISVLILMVLCAMCGLFLYAGSSKNVYKGRH